MSDINSNFIGKVISKVRVYLILIIALTVGICIYDKRWILPGILLNIVVMAYAFWDNTRRKNEIVSHIEELTMDVSTASKSTLVNSPVPLVLIQTDGNIIWRSKKFTEVFGGIEVNTYLTPIVKEIKLEADNNNEITEFTKTINIEGKAYQVKSSISKRDRR